MASNQEMPWTSIQAFKRVLPRLGGDRKQVLEWLIDYTNAVGQPPTARELDTWVTNHGLSAASDIVRKVGRRLGELRVKDNAIHKGVTRKCGKTTYDATTWVLGPPSGEEVNQFEPEVVKGYDAQIYVLDVNYGWAERSLRMVSSETDCEGLQDEVLDTYLRAHPEEQGKAHQVWLFSYEEVEA